MPGAERRRADHHLRTLGREPHARRLERVLRVLDAATTRLDVGGDADADPGGRTLDVLLRLPLAQPGVVRQLEHRVGRRGVVPDVVRRPTARRVGEGVLRDPVLAPELDRIDAELGGEVVDDALDRVRRLGSAGAAVGADRCLVGERGLAVDAVVGDPVDAGVHLQAAARGARTDRGDVGTRVADQVHVERGDLALAGGGDGEVLDDRAAVERGLEVLTPRRVPRHRPLQLARGEQRDDLLGVEELAAEAAAHVGSDDAHAVLVDSGALRHEVPDDVRSLGRDPGREPVALRRDDDGPRLHRGREHARLLEPTRQHDVGGRQGSIDVAGALAVVGGLVARRALVQQQRVVGQRRLGVVDRRQVVVVEVDELGSVDRGSGRARDDDGHRLADVPHRVGGDELHARALLEARQLRTPACEVRTCPDREHIRCAARFGDIDGEPRMRHRAPHEDEMRGPLRSDVGRPPRAAGDQVVVLGAQHRCMVADGGHASSLFTGGQRDPSPAGRTRSRDRRTPSDVPRRAPAPPATEPSRRRRRRPRSPGRDE